jgi:hypothetical protein
MLKQDFPWVTSYPLRANIGFSASNNLVIRKSDARYLLLLNPDTELREGVIDHVQRTIENDPKIGMVGCRLEQRDGTFDHAAKRSFPTPLAALGHFLRIGRGTGATRSLSQYRAPEVPEDGLGRVDAINGAFMFVRRDAVKDVGLLDEGYWLYMEDLDWCRRFHDAGWDVVYDGRVTALHLKGASSGARRRARQNIAFHRGMGRFYRRYEAGDRPALDLIVYAGIMLKLGLSLMQNTTLNAVSATARRVSRRP